MRDIKGSTSEEVRMIRAIQRSVGALDNGWIGNQTLSDIAAKLGGYDPELDGFTGVYSDVLRKTNHTVLGYKGGLLYGVYCRSMTAQQVNALCRDKLKLEYAGMLDGGHVAAINGACNKINTHTRQFYAVRFL